MEIIFGGWGLASSQEPSSTAAGVCRRTATTREMSSLIINTVSFWGATIASSTRPTSEKRESVWPQAAAFLQMLLTSSLSTKGTTRHWVWDVSGEHAGLLSALLQLDWVSTPELQSEVCRAWKLLLTWRVQSWWALACCCCCFFHLLMRVTNLNNGLSVVTLLPLQWALNISTLISRQALYVSWFIRLQPTASQHLWTLTSDVQDQLKLYSKCFFHLIFTVHVSNSVRRTFPQTTHPTHPTEIQVSAFYFSCLNRISGCWIFTAFS